MYGKSIHLEMGLGSGYFQGYKPSMGGGGGSIGEALTGYVVQLTIPVV